MSNEHEWTAENVLMMLQSSQLNTPYSDVAKAHNASIAAERERIMAEWSHSESQRNIMSKMTIAEVEQLREQLAAEKEKYDALERTYGEVRDELKSQLAAERKKNSKGAYEMVMAENKQLRTQLDAQEPVYASQIAWEGDNLLADKDKQLAAERKSVKELQDEIDRLKR